MKQMHNIPKGWKFLKLMNLVTQDIKNGYSPNCPDEPNGSWILSLGNITENGLDQSQAKPAPMNDDRVKDFLLEPGDFLISRSNTLDKVGRTVLFRGEIENCSYPDLLMRFRVDETQVTNEYLESYLRSTIVRKYIQGCASGTSNSMVKINKKVVEKIPVILPPLPEQKTIAALLSTWDKAIEKTEQLIQAKEKRFKWLLRELISEPLKTREDTEWKKVKLGDIADIRTGSKDNQNKIADGKYPFFVRSQTVERIDSYSYDGEAILIPGEGKIGEIIHHLIGKFDYHQRVYKISDFSEATLGKYVFFYLKQHFPKHAKKYSVKATADSLRLPVFKEMTVFLPPLEAQKGISETLVSAQYEINLLTQLAYKYKTQKRGLMQKMLTGEWRVKPEIINQYMEE